MRDWSAALGVEPGSALGIGAVLADAPAARESILLNVLPIQDPEVFITDFPQITSYNRW